LVILLQSNNLKVVNQDQLFSYEFMMNSLSYSRHHLHLFVLFDELVF